MGDIQPFVVNTFIKGPDSVYEHMTPGAAELAGVPGGVYDPDLRWADDDLPWADDTVESVLAEDQTIRRYGRTSQSVTVMEDAKGQWRYTACTKWLMPDDRIEAQCITVPSQLVYNGWLTRLDFDKERLTLANGNWLTRNEMRTLHRVLAGAPRKLIAEREHRSVKAIEKRLAVIRGKLCSPDHGCYNIQTCVYNVGLTQFLLAHADWFALKNTHCLIQPLDHKLAVTQ